MIKLLKIDDLTMFDDSKELFELIVNKTMALVYYGGKVINPALEFDLQLTAERFEGSGGRLFDSTGCYSSISEFEYMIIDLTELISKSEYDWVYNVSEVVEELLKAI